MFLIIAAVIVLVASGLIALLFMGNARLAGRAAVSGSVISAVIGLVSVYLLFINRTPEFFSAVWAVPYASVSFNFDMLSAVFLLPVFILTPLCALYGAGYMSHYGNIKSIAVLWFFYNMLAASMVVVITASNAVLFLAAWEIMSVSSFFLVIFENQKKEVRRAGFIYISAMHIGTLFLLVMFIILGNQFGTFDFSLWGKELSALPAGLIFVLAVIGFGTKAGFMPLHIWLPEAHPAAPAFVSALMSGVMVKTGLYGLIRILTFIGTTALWWGFMLVAIGILSGVLGILFALAQRDLKRLLAYSTIENVGIICIGIGVGIIGVNTGNRLLEVLGFGGGLLHMINHAFFKGLLFLGAGAALHKTSTSIIGSMGGLLKKMPITGFCFLAGSAAACALPPLNGFVSEFILYYACLNGLTMGGDFVILFAAVIAVLAFVGCLCAVCFTKAFGIIFLGEPRNGESGGITETCILEIIPMAVLAALCVAAGVAFPFIIALFGEIYPSAIGIVNPLYYIIGVSVVLCSAAVVLLALRKYLLRGRKVASSLTWDCGYLKPRPGMQYTGSSYIQPLIEFFKGILSARKHSSKLNGYFPDEFLFKTEVSDVFNRKIFYPSIKLIQNITEHFKRFQHGKLQFYILYILITVIALLVWKL